MSEQQHTVENDAYKSILMLLLENVPLAVSGEDIIVREDAIPAPAHLRAALAGLMDEIVDTPIPPAEPCRECGPGYRFGDEGCRHAPPGSTEEGGR